jgi:CubicO group peptidase (beta-lactamase class C family)
MSDEIFLQGYCSPQFEAAGRVFQNNFPEFGELGASCCVYVEGEAVVDIWGGWADVAKTKPWQEDTLSGFYSVGKSFTALCALRAADQHGFELDAPLADVWPEYGQNGKQQTTLRHLLTHRAGMPAIRKPLPDEALFDWALLVNTLAEQAPYWQPGTEHGYHTNTMGLLVGEFVRRISGLPVDQYFQQQIAQPLGADTHFGLSDEDLKRAAEISWPAQEQAAQPASAAYPASTEETPVEQSPEVIEHIQMMKSAYSNPSGISSLGVYNTDGWRQTVAPSANGFGTAKGIARIYNALAHGGTINGYEVIKQSRLEEARKIQCEGLDRILRRDIRWGLGFQLTHPNRPMGPNPNSFGHFGNGGSLGFADPDKKLAFGYTLNRIVRDWGSPQNKALMKAVYSCL